MNDFDFDRLSQVWREEPPAAEVEWMRQSAMKVSRRARAAQRLETLAAVLVAAMAVFFVIISPYTQTFVASAGAILVLLTTQRRQRRLRAVELQSLTGGTEQMLDQSIARTQATIKRNRFSLIGIGPATLLGLFLAHSVRGRVESGPAVEQSTASALSAAVLLLLIGVVIYLAMEIRRSRLELHRLQALRDSYSAEGEPGEH